MNSVDRATLIDFALGRLDDAEAAALANRAERDSEFAQTLAALRRELASLDAVCPSASALRALPLRSPLFDAVETTFPPQTPLSTVDDAQNVVLLDAPSPNAVKVRRVGPVYPFYGDEDGQNNQNEQLSQNKQDALNEQNDKDAQDLQDKQNNEDKPNNQDKQFDENAQDKRLSEDKQNAPNTQSSASEQDAQNRQFSEYDRNSKHKRPNEDKQDNLNKQVGESELLPSTQARPPRRFNFIPKFIAASRADQDSAFVAKRARFLNDAQEDALPQVVLSRSDEFQDVAPLQNLETTQLNVQDTENADESTRENEQETSEKSNYCNDDNKNVAVFEISNEERSGEKQSAQADVAPLQNLGNASSNAERRLVELLGREPTPTERDEYYWEPIDEEFEEVNAEFQSKKRRSLLGAPTRFATETTIAIGRATLALCGFERRAALGSDAFAATKARRKRQPGRISDMMISTVSGLLIAVVVVWPLLCLAAKEVLATIALSAVRKIGVNVQISESAPQQDVLPLITEYIVFPRSSESAALQSLDAAPPQETGARFETPTLDDVPVVKPAAVPAAVPASTPPTLVPAPAAPAEAYNAPLDDAEKSPNEAPFLLNDV